MGRLPNFVIIGAMRSGTSSLAGYLASHPDLFMAPRKELHFFNRHYDEGLEWYRQRFADSTSQSAVGEATPTYIYDKQSIDRMAADIGEAKLIAILREPVSRAYSHYWFNRSRGYEPMTFEEALAAEGQRLDGADPLTRARYSYVDRGRYVDQLEHVATRFPDDQVHVLLVEDLKRSPAATYGAVCAFLGIDSEFRPENLGAPVNAFYRARWPKLNQAVKGFPKPVRTAVKVINRADAEPYPPIESETRDRLRSEFSDSVARLERLLDRDLDAWR
ncbi:MAG: hypothetical protein HKN07_10165 [Acidimicrobiia bacterium]|nr:sulfotransferase domain-containing protein [Acidimicrobiia bacterium]NNF64610.1 hypothetical protein [Acidimicrobiia bacterium]